MPFSPQHIEERVGFPKQRTASLFPNWYLKITILTSDIPMSL